MELSNILNGIFNEQILHEYRNQLIYTQLESVFENFQLKNIAKYFHEQSLQEKGHGDKFVEYLNSRTGGEVKIAEIDFPIIPDYTVDNMVTIGDLYVSTEEGTTKSIESIYEFALQSKSYIDLPILSEMLQEQVEEEDSANAFALNIKMTKDMVLFDKSFGE